MFVRYACTGSACSLRKECKLLKGESGEERKKEKEKKVRRNGNGTGLHTYIAVNHITGAHPTIIGDTVP